jgi:type IV pilus assembly protein PilE
VKSDKGFTLVEILIAIVLVGILSAVAVVGISSLVSKGSSSACSATLDSSKAASSVYFAANNNTYPINFTQLTTATGSGATLVPAALTLPSNVAIGASPFTTLTSGTSWTLTMTPGSGTTAPTFVCS